MKLRRILCFFRYHHFYRKIWDDTTHMRCCLYCKRLEMWCSEKATSVGWQRMPTTRAFRLKRLL